MDTVYFSWQINQETIYLQKQRTGGKNKTYLITHTNLDKLDVMLWIYRQIITFGVEKYRYKTNKKVGTESYTQETLVDVIIQALGKPEKIWKQQ